MGVKTEQVALLCIIKGLGELNYSGTLLDSNTVCKSSNKGLSFCFFEKVPELCFHNVLMTNKPMHILFFFF